VIGCVKVIEAVSGVARPQGGWPAAVFYSLGQPMPYTCECLCFIPFCLDFEDDLPVTFSDLLLTFGVMSQSGDEVVDEASTFLQDAPGKCPPVITTLWVQL
jgi:hypothetical protein